MGISPTYLSNLLHGHRPWSLPLRERFAGAVGKAEAEFDFAKTYAKPAATLCRQSMEIVEERAS